MRTLQHHPTTPRSKCRFRQVPSHMRLGKVWTVTTGLGAHLRDGQAGCSFTRLRSFWSLTLPLPLSFPTMWQFKCSFPKKITTFQAEGLNDMPETKLLYLTQTRTFSYTKEVAILLLSPRTRNFILVYCAGMRL